MGVDKKVRTKDLLTEASIRYDMNDYNGCKLRCEQALASSSSSSVLRDLTKQDDLTDGHLRRLLGSSLLKLGNDQDATEHLERAREIMEENASSKELLECYLCLGEAYSRQEQPLVAQKIYLKALSLSNQTTREMLALYRDLARSYAQQGSWLDAIDTYAECNDWLDSHDGGDASRVAQNHLQMGNLFKENGRRKEAAAHYRHAMPSVDACLGLGETTDDPKEAWETLQQAKQMSAGHDHIHQLESDWQRTIKQQEQATKQQEQATKQQEQATKQQLDHDSLPHEVTVDAENDGSVSTMDDSRHMSTINLIWLPKSVLDMMNIIVECEMKQAKAFINTAFSVGEQRSMGSSSWWRKELRDVSIHLYTSDTKDRGERMAILESPSDFEFYLSFMIVACNMLLVCESLVYNRDGGQRDYYESIIQKGVEETMSDVHVDGLAAVGNGRIKGLSSSSSDVPSLERFLSLFALHCHNHEDQKRCVARVFRFVAVGNFMQHGTGGIKATLELVGRYLTRKRSASRARYDQDLKLRCNHIIRSGDDVPCPSNNTPLMGSTTNQQQESGGLAATELLMCLMLGHRDDSSMRDVMEGRGMPSLAVDLHIPCLTTMLCINPYEVRRLPVFQNIQPTTNRGRPTPDEYNPAMPPDEDNGKHRSAKDYIAGFSVESSRNPPSPTMRYNHARPPNEHYDRFQPSLNKEYDPARSVGSNGNRVRPTPDEYGQVRLPPTNKYDQTRPQSEYDQAGPSRNEYNGQVRPPLVNNYNDSARPPNTAWPQSEEQPSRGPQQPRSQPGSISSASHHSSVYQQQQQGHPTKYVEQRERMVPNPSSSSREDLSHDKTDALLSAISDRKKNFFSQTRPVTEEGSERRRHPIGHPRDNIRHPRGDDALDSGRPSRPNNRVWENTPLPSYHGGDQYRKYNGNDNWSNVRQQSNDPTHGDRYMENPGARPGNPPRSFGVDSHYPQNNTTQRYNSHNGGYRAPQLNAQVRHHPSYQSGGYGYDSQTYNRDRGGAPFHNQFQAEQRAPSHQQQPRNDLLPSDQLRPEGWPQSHHPTRENYGWDDRAPRHNYDGDDGQFTGSTGPQSYYSGGGPHDGNWNNASYMTPEQLMSQMGRLQQSLEQTIRDTRPLPSSARQPNMPSSNGNFSPASSNSGDSTNLIEQELARLKMAVDRDVARAQSSNSHTDLCWDQVVDERNGEITALKKRIDAMSQASKMDPNVARELKRSIIRLRSHFEEALL